MKEDLSSSFDSLDEWLNDENIIVRNIHYIQHCVYSKPRDQMSSVMGHVVNYENALFPVVGPT